MINSTSLFEHKRGERKNYAIISDAFCFGVRGNYMYKYDGNYDYFVIWTQKKWKEKSAFCLGVSYNVRQ